MDLPDTFTGRKQGIKDMAVVLSNLAFKRHLHGALARQLQDLADRRFDEEIADLEDQHRVKSGWGSFDGKANNTGAV
jgi:hypothetical protein